MKWTSIVRTGVPDSQNEQLSDEALQSLAKQMQIAAESGEQLRVLMQQAIDSVPQRLYRMIADGRATFAPTYDASGKIVAISVVPKE